MISQFINNGKDENRVDRAEFLQQVIDNDVIENTLEKQYKSILRSCDKLFHKNNVIVPIQNNDGVISIDKQYQDSLYELAKADGGLAGLIEPYSKTDDKKE
jgi:hypothetical protein